MKQPNKKHSKFISLLLRHKPETVGLTLDEYGWAEVDELLLKVNKNGKNITKEDLVTIVTTNDKQRFTFNNDQTKIRANQGHSININLGYEAVAPPATLYHGTATRFLDSIFEKGLIKGNRHHVHLSADLETAQKVGVRHGKLAILLVDTAAMYQDGYEFFVSKNGVWLTDHVPVKYLQNP